MANILDLFFPAAKPLRDAASGGDSTAASDAASKAATARAAANPSGIDVAAEAQKAAARAKTPVSTQGPSSTPVSSGGGTRDHYKPRGN